MLDPAMVRQFRPRLVREGAGSPSRNGCLGQAVWDRPGWSDSALNGRAVSVRRISARTGLVDIGTAVVVGTVSLCKARRGSNRIGS